jgi:hypothetical protein
MKLPLRYLPTIGAASTISRLPLVITYFYGLSHVVSVYVDNIENRP